MISFVWRRFHFCAIKSNQGFIIILDSYCSRMQFCSASTKFMSDDILVMIHVQLGL